MDFKSYAHITLNNQVYSKEDILNLGIENSHFGETIEFLQNWFSDSIEITVQTSGSTGVPKKITIPKQSFVESARNTCQFLKLNSQSNALLCIPIQYIGGKMMVIRALVSGYNLWIEEPSASPLVEFEKTCSFLAITPMQAQNIVNNSPDKLKQINHVIIGGGAVTTNFIEEIKEYPNEFYSTYGMTETVSHIAMKRLNGTKKSDVFEMLPSYFVSVTTDNCLIIDCPTLFPSQIETNDIVKLTETGFKWLGRKDNVINSGGIKISPEEVEKEISTIFPELTFYITSKQDDMLGEKLVMVTNSSQSIDFKKTSLEKYKIPKEIIVIPLTYTETGKIIRKKF